MNENQLGSCATFIEEKIGGERYNIFEGCPKAKTCTMILRGGAEQFLEETERSLHDAIMIVRRACKSDRVVAGGGAIEMELSKYLRDHSRTIKGKEQMLMNAYAKALEVRIFLLHFFFFHFLIHSKHQWKLFVFFRLFHNNCVIMLVLILLIC